MAMGAALSVRPEFDSAQHLKGGGRGRVGSAGTPSLSFRLWGYLDSHSPWLLGRYFPWQSQHLVMQHPPLFDPDLPGTSPFPGHLPPLPPATITQKLVLDVPLWLCLLGFGQRVSELCASSSPAALHSAASSGASLPPVQGCFDHPASRVISP